MIIDQPFPFVSLPQKSAQQLVILSPEGAKDLLLTSFKEKAGPSLRALTRAPLRMTSARSLTQQKEGENRREKTGTLSACLCATC